MPTDTRIQTDGHGGHEMTTALDIATNYVSRGYCPVPIPHRQKGPRLLEWQKLRIGVDEVLQYFNGEAQNIGVLLGAPSGNLIDVDLDSMEAVRLADAMLPPTDSIFGRAGKPRSHRLYRAISDCGRTEKFKDHEGAMQVEFRATGGQTVFPGSTHECGESIEWDTDGEPQSVEPAKLLGAVRELAAAAILLAVYPAEGSRHDVALALAGGLLRAGWNVQRVESFLQAIVVAAGDNELEDRLAAVQSTATQIRNDSKASGWPSLVKLIGSERIDRVRDLLGLRESLSEVSDGAKNDDYSFPAPIESERARNESSWVPIPATQLAAEATPIEWIWGGYLALGFVTLLSALWKSGKTTLLARLLQAFERGEDMAGAIQSVRVLYVSEEPASIWARRVCELGLSDSIHFLNLPFTTRPGRPEYQHFIARLAELVRENVYGLVVIDTFGQVSPANDENAAAEMTAALMPLRQITEAGASLLLVHHSRKGDGKEFQASRGSGAIPGFADILIELRRYDPENDDSRRTLKAISRFEETPAEVVIELRVDGYHAVGSKADVKQSERLDVIRAILVDADDPVDAEAVHQGWPDSEVTKPCQRIVRSDLKYGHSTGLWKRSGEGKRGSPYTYAALDSFPACSPSIGARNENEGSS